MVLGLVAAARNISCALGPGTSREHIAVALAEHGGEGGGFDAYEATLGLFDGPTRQVDRGRRCD